MMNWPLALTLLEALSVHHMVFYTCPVGYEMDEDNCVVDLL